MAGMDENPYKAPADQAARLESSTNPRLKASDYLALILAIITIVVAFYGLLHGFTDLGAALSN
jgi:hypothetical protein